MGLLGDCKLYFGSDNLYVVLGITQNASEAELKKAYKKTSLLCHPDRVSEDEKEKATKKFQTLSKVHSILTDQEQRAVYDETGCIDEEASGLGGDKDWNDYWRFLFPKLTVRDIEIFFQKYTGSEEEREDLKKCYLQFEGDMNKISECFIGYDVSKEDEIQETLRELIKNEEVPDFPKFTNEKKTRQNARKKKLKKEADELENDQQSQCLMQALMHRSAVRESQFNDMIKSMEDKYCKKETKKRKK